MQSIKIKYSPGMPKLEQHGDWIDLFTADTIKAKAGETVKVSLGVAMEIPKGYEAHILPRSSTFKKTGLILTNSMGIIDNDYNGDNDIWGAMFYATDDVAVSKHTRLLQFRLVENMAPVKFVTVDELLNDNRGGYGSTGTGQSSNSIVDAISTMMKHDLEMNEDTTIISKHGIATSTKAVQND